MATVLERPEINLDEHDTIAAGKNGYLTYEEFLEHSEGKFAEWVDGEMMLMMSCSDEHQDLQRFLLKAVDTWVEVHNLGITRAAPFQMRLEQRPSGREPDILFVATENRGRMRKTFLDGPADLAIEIVSPESLARDRGDKFVEYEEAGVREYWLIDQPRQRAEFYQLDDAGTYRLTEPDDDGIYHSKVLSGLWMREAWLWQKPLPKLLDILREWKLI